MSASLQTPSRRGFLAGLGSLFVAAPAIVRATSLMPVKAWSPTNPATNPYWSDIGPESTRLLIERMNDDLYGNLAAVTRKAFVPRLYVQIYKASPILKWGTLAEDDPLPFGARLVDLD